MAAELKASMLAQKGQAHPVGARQDHFTRQTALIRDFFVSPGSKKTTNLVCIENQGLTGSRVKKTLRLQTGDHVRLRRLAAKLGVPQQRLMEDAVRKLLRKADQQK